MADTNTYTSKQNIKKYTTQAKFDAIDKSDVPVGTEYNIVGSIAESDLDSDLQAKVNLTGDGFTTEITGGKVKVKNPMTSTGGNGFKLNSFYNATTGVTYFFPIETPIGHFTTGIVPIIGSITGTKPGSTAPATYQGLLLPNAYSENNYGPNAYAMLTMSESSNSGNQIYILPYCSSNQGVSRLLSTESLEAGTGITIQYPSGAPGRLKISADSGGGTTYTAGKNIVIDGTTIKTKEDVTFDTAVVNALTVASTGIFTRGPINRVPNINFGTSAEPLTATGIYSFANIFTTYNNATTTYNFKIPSVGGVADIRFPNITYGNLVAQEQLKTFFGNQSLVGSGNIDLYNHKIEYSNINGDIFGYSTFYSSKNLQCGSLSDLRTLLGDNFNIAVYPISGYLINNWIPLSLDTFNMMILDITGETAKTNTIDYNAFTFTDTVTAI